MDELPLDLPLRLSLPKDGSFVINAASPYGPLHVRLSPAAADKLYELLIGQSRPAPK